MFRKGTGAHSEEETRELAEAGFEHVFAPSKNKLLGKLS